MELNPNLTFEELNDLERYVWRRAVYDSLKARYQYEDDLTIPLPDPKVCFKTLEVLINNFINDIDSEMEYQFHQVYGDRNDINIYYFIIEKSVEIMTLIDEYRKEHNYRPGSLTNQP